MKDSLLLKPATTGTSTPISSGGQSSNEKHSHNLDKHNLHDKSHFSEEFEKAGLSNQPTQVELTRDQQPLTQSTNTDLTAEYIQPDNLIFVNTSLQTQDLLGRAKINENKDLPIEGILQTIKSNDPLSNAEFESSEVFLRHEGQTILEAIEPQNSISNIDRQIVTEGIKTKDSTSTSRNTTQTGTEEQNLLSTIKSNIEISDNTSKSHNTKQTGAEEQTQLATIKSSAEISDNENSVLKSENETDKSVSTSFFSQTDIEENQSVLETIKSTGPTANSDTLIEEQIGASEDTLSVKDKNISDIQKLQTNQNIDTNSIAQIDDLERVQLGLTTPNIIQNETIIAKHDSLIRFETTATNPSTIIKNAEVTPPQNSQSEALSNETNISTDPETSETHKVDLDTIEIDAVDIDENDVILKREILQTLGTAGAPTNLFGTTGLDTTFSNTLNSSFSLGTVQTQLTGATTLTMPPSAPIATPAHSNAVINTVAQAMLVAKETSQGVTVQLDPPEMGRVYIDFMFESESQVSVVVKSDTIASHDILRERADQFTQMLKDNGFENINLSFEQENSGNTDTGDQNDDPEFGASRYTTAENLEPQDQSYSSAVYTSNQDNLRLDLKL